MVGDCGTPTVVADVDVVGEGGDHPLRHWQVGVLDRPMLDSHPPLGGDSVGLADVISAHGLVS